MYKIGVMGGRETVMGFKALGLDVFPVDSADEARHTLRPVSYTHLLRRFFYFSRSIRSTRRREGGFPLYRDISRYTRPARAVSSPARALSLIHI